MKKLHLKATWLIATVCLMACYSCKNQQPNEPESPSTGFNLTEVRKTIEAIDHQFSVDFKNGDSIALAAHYASDGTLGSIKGHENLVKAWGQMIRNAIKEGNPIVEYTINSLSSDGEFLAELGKYEFKDNEGNVKDQGKYLLIWKLENGEWKIYKDMGL